jgi:hypothetical protein
MDAEKIREKLVCPYPYSKRSLTKMDLIRATFLNLQMNLLALLLAGLKHFLQQIHLLRLMLTRFAILMIVYHRKDLFSPMGVVQYPLSSIEQSGPNLKGSKLATRTYVPCPLASSSVWEAQRVSVCKILPSMAK